MAKLNIYHLFAPELVSKRSRRQKREKNQKKKKVSGSDLYLLIQQLAVLINA